MSINGEGGDHVNIRIKGTQEEISALLQQRQISEKAIEFSKALGQWDNRESTCNTPDIPRVTSAAGRSS